MNYPWKYHPLIIFKIERFNDKIKSHTFLCKMQFDWGGRLLKYNEGSYKVNLYWFKDP